MERRWTLALAALLTVLWIAIPAAELSAIAPAARPAGHVAAPQASGDAGRGADFLVSTAPDYQGMVDLAHNSSGDEYLVVWEDRRQHLVADIYGQIVSADGILRGEPIARAPRPAAQGEALPFEAEIVAFVKTLLGHMGFKAQVVVGSREPKRLGIDVETDKSAVLIGKQGKTLEAFQFICNLAASRLGAEGTRVIIDTQDYRSRREHSLERMAAQAADRVRRSRESVLLEPLNPFERRIVHTAIARRGDVETESEGDGLYKRIRVSLKGGGGSGGNGGNGGGRREGGGNGGRRGGSRGRDPGYGRDGDGDRDRNYGRD